MRFPWQRRADEQEQHRLSAEKRLAEVRADWPKVQRHVEELRKQRELNGWTDTIIGIFGAPKSREGRS